MWEAEAVPRVSPLRRRSFAGLAVLTVVVMLAGVADPVATLLSGDELAHLHRIHDVTALVHALLFVVLAGSQVVSPVRFASALGLLFVGVGLYVPLMAATGGVNPIIVALLVLIGVLTALHPTRGAVFRPGVPSLPLLGLAVAVAVPLVVLAVDHLGLQRRGWDPSHADPGHWVNMAGWWLALPVAAVWAAVRPRGWRLIAWAAGLGGIATGVQSLVSPTLASTFGVDGGIVAVVAGAGFIAVAEVVARDEGRIFATLSAARADR